MKRILLVIIFSLLYLILFRDSSLMFTIPGFSVDGNQTKTVVASTRFASGSSSLVVSQKSWTNKNVEPYVNRWHRRFSSSKSRNKTGGYLFFKHMRKTGGTSLRVYLRDVLNYHGFRCDVDTFRNAKNPVNSSSDDRYEIYYIEHEFQTMHWECPIVDPRWEESMRIITLRHPIERHMSEFFFSGPGIHFPIDRHLLYTNKTYTRHLSNFLDQNVKLWIEQEGGGLAIIKKFGEMQGRFNMYFGRFYTNNFQLRALAGCSTRECSEKKNVSLSQITAIESLHPYAHSYSTPFQRCTQFIHKENKLFDPCAKSRRINEECQFGCDGPCFYPSVAWGKIDLDDLNHAIQALEAFDAVLLMETMSNPDQLAFLADILGVPRNANFSLSYKNMTNVSVEKVGRHEKTHFYRDLLSTLSPTSLELLMKENELEMEFFQRAKAINKQKTNDWLRESQWHLD